MSDETDITISCKNNERVSIDVWDEGGMWLFLQGRQASMSTTLTRAEAKQLVASMQLILDKEVSA